MQRAEARRRRCVLARFVTVTKVNQTNQVMAYIVYVSAVFPVPSTFAVLCPTKQFVRVRRVYITRYLKARLPT